MIVLSSADKVQVVLGEAAGTELHCIASFRDVTANSYQPDRALALTNDTTAVDWIAAPGTGVQRVIDFLSVYNADGIPHIVAVMIDTGGTDKILWRGTLGLGETLSYVEGAGWATNAVAPAVSAGYPAQLGYMGV